MAPMTKWWIGIVVAGSALLAAGVVGWAERAIQVQGPSVAMQSRSEYWAALEEEARTARALRNLRVVRAIREAGAPHTLLALGGLDTIDAGAELNRLVAAEVARAERIGDAVVAIAPAAWQMPDSTRRRVGWSRGAHFAMLDGDRPLCAAILFPSIGWGRAEWFTARVRSGSMLGPCWWVARYGPPSDSVAAWLRRGGGRFAWLYGDSATHRAIRSPQRMLGARDFAALSIAEEGCVDGVIEACEGIIARPVREGGTAFGKAIPFNPADPTLYVPGYSVRATFDGAAVTLLDNFETEVGPDAFRRFWTSEEDILTAMSEALGRRTGDWVHAWATDRLTTPPTRAAIAPGDWLLTLLALGLLTGLAILLARRKRA